ncbi:lens fiber membrane intrinsic protein-like isoform X1 [Pleurodeles waltl]|uniref:lens fiber membrane intrinsic protein-like isoform X1 n=2 Tax=Pleurodeles waltl TaxID=8319 RepID=UPI00370993CD
MLLTSATNAKTADMWSSFAHSIPLPLQKQTMVELKIIGMLCSWTSSVFLIIATSNDFWITSNTTVHSGNIGLWRNCMLNTWSPVPPGTGYLDATKAFLILSTMAGLVAGFASFSVLNSCSCGRVTGVLVAFITSCTGAVCDVTAMAVFTFGTAEMMRTTPTLSYDWCFCLGWGALLFFAISGVSYLMLLRGLPVKEENEVQYSDL